MAQKALLCIFVLLTAALFAGCEKKSPPAPVGAVKVNPAFVEHFGQPPTPDSGTCYARVGYYPLRNDPGKVRPVPFFLFREEGQLELLLERLVSGEVSFPADSALYNPFPAGTRLQVRSPAEGAVELVLALAGTSVEAEELAIMAAALTETALQFDEVNRIRILLDGSPLPGMPQDGFVHEPQRIAPPGSPTLLLIVGNWERGAPDLEEILANFDRPVTIESFRLRDSVGKEIQGKYFQSVFNMAVVVHPEEPSAFREGVGLSAEWVVTDALGRMGKGSGVFALGRHEHP